MRGSEIKRRLRRAADTVEDLVEDRVGLSRLYVFGQG